MCGVVFHVVVSMPCYGKMYSDSLDTSNGS